MFLLSFWKKGVFGAGMKAYVPVSFSVNLIKFNASIKNPIITLCSPVARYGYPRLEVNHSHKYKEEYEYV